MKRLCLLLLVAGALIGTGCSTRGTAPINVRRHYSRQTLRYVRENNEYIGGGTYVAPEFAKRVR